MDDSFGRGDCFFGFSVFAVQNGIAGAAVGRLGLVVGHGDFTAHRRRVLVSAELRGPSE